MRHSCCSRASLLALTALFFLDALARGAESQAPTVTTRPATALGLSAMTVNGSIHPHGRPTTHYFEYGPTVAYGSKTAAMPLPPRLAAYYHETWDENLGGWGTWLKPTHFPTGGAVNGYIRLAEPSRDDHNHDNGIGTVHLTKYLYPGPLTGTPSVYLGGGDPDFRDAKIAVWVRGNDWKPNGSELLWWTQSQSNIEKDNTGWRRANWAYTGFNLTDYLMDGKWHKVEYRLLNDTSNWTYTGGTGGYVYWSIDRAQ